MYTLQEYVCEVHTRHLQRPTYVQRAETEATQVMKLKIFENRVALMRADEAKKTKGQAASWRRTPREKWSGADLLASWKEDAAICEKVPRKDEVSNAATPVKIPMVQRMCPVRGFRSNPFVIDTMFHGRHHSFTLDCKGDKDTQGDISVGYTLIRVVAAEGLEELAAGMKSALEAVVASRGDIVDLVESVLWPFLAKVEMMKEEPNVPMVVQ